MAVNRDQLLKLVDDMPTFPSSAHRIIELTSNVDCAPKDLVGVIEHDPILTLKVLKLVNSSYFGLAAEVTSVKHAVVYLGINTVKNLALSVAAMGALPSQNSLGYNMSQFWWHSLVCAGAARSIAAFKKISDVQISNAFVAGLVHDIGKVMFVHFLPEEYKQCMSEFAKSNRPPSAIETEIIGASHGEMGALLVERWQLPPALTAVIRNHHNLQSVEGPTDLDCALFLGNQLSKKLSTTALQMAQIEEAPKTVSAWIGGLALEDLLKKLPDLAREGEKADMLISLA